MPDTLLAWQTLRPGLSAWYMVGTQALGGMNEVSFKSPALRHHLCSLQSSHGAQTGPEAKALESRHCKKTHLYSQVPTELRSHCTLFLPLALEIGATVYLPKVSSHSTSSSIVRSKSSNEGLPSGFSCQHLSITSYKYLDANFGRWSRWPRVTMVTTS